MVLRLFIFFVLFTSSLLAAKSKVHALYIPLADHYTAIVAYERYSATMKHADFQLSKMKNWDLLRAYFQEGNADMAFVMTPLAIDMFNEKPHFRWTGLMHRDGNALAINTVLDKEVSLAQNKIDRKPEKQMALAFHKVYHEDNHRTKIGLPHRLSTHTVILYKFLKEHDIQLALSSNDRGEVLAISVAPPRSPAYMKRKNGMSTPAAIEQSLPWSDIVEMKGYGKIAWYSKDVMPTEHGHVECISIATDDAIKTKFKAIKEVQYYLHKAGADIEHARRAGGSEFSSIIAMIRKHIPQHSVNAIKSSLRPDTRAINYSHLNIDKQGLKLIMDYALEGKILDQGVDIDTFADERFVIELERSHHEK